MTLKQAIEYVNMYFEFNTEIRSYLQDETENGVFNKEQFEKFDDETKIAIGEDVRYQVRQEVGMYF